MTSILRHPVAVALFVACAAGDVRSYLFNRSLWVDEAMLAVAVLESPDPLAPLPYAQVAPFGFIVAAKWIVHAGGTSELALRAMPLLAALLVMPLVLIAAARHLSRSAALFAAALVGLSPALHYFASEFKPYALDMAACAALFAVAARVDVRPRQSVMILTILGAALSWWSLPVVFVLCGVWAATVLHLRGRVPPALLVAGITITATSFAGAYAAARSLVPDVATLQSYWSSTFLVMPRDLDDLRQWGSTWLAFFGDPFHAETDPWQTADRLRVVVALFWGVGVMVTIRSAPWRAVLIAVPFVALLGAAVTGYYPPAGRLIAILAPPAALGAGAGLDALRARLGERFAAGTAVLILLLPATSFVHRTLTPLGREEVRDVLMSLEQHLVPTDVVYVSYGAVPAYEYYARTGRLQFPAGTRVVKGAISREDWQGYVREICKTRSMVSRTWVVQAHDVPGENEHVRRTLQLDRAGSAIRKTGAAAYLLGGSWGAPDTSCAPF